MLFKNNFAVKTSSETHRCSSRHSADRRWRICLWVVVGFAALVNFSTFKDYVFEDAYITYSYAQNLAAGNGLVFNQGERVLGTTTPFYALLLGLLAWLGGDIPLLSGVLFAGSMAWIGLLGGSLLGRWGSWRAGLLFALLISWGAGNWIWLWGMETAFYTALLLTALWLTLEERSLAAGICLGIAFVTRYDAILFALTLWFLDTVKQRRLPLRSILAATGVALPWLLFAQLYYGSVVPNTLGAKMAKTPMGEYLWASWIRQLDQLISPLLRFSPPRRLIPALRNIASWLLLLPILVAGWRVVRRELLATQLLLFPLALWFGYSLIGPGTGHSWHLLPALCCILLLSLIAWSRLLTLVKTAPWLNFCQLLVLVAALIWLPISAATHARQLTDNGFYRGRVEAYADLAGWINDQRLNELKILTQEPGYIRFLTGNPMIDAAGLTTRGVVTHQGERQKMSFASMIEQHQPELIMAPGPYRSGLDLSDFIPLIYPLPIGTVFIRRSTHREHFNHLAESWLTSGPPTARQLALPTELRVDFAAGDSVDFSTSGRLGGSFVRQKRARKKAPEGLDPPYLSTHGERWGSMVTPPFRIEFDELSFQFAATNPYGTLARLLIDRQEVYRITGEAKDPPPVHTVRWPVGHWRGKEAVIQFQDLLRDPRYLAADRLRSCRHRRVELVADFESPSYGGIWQTTFGERPTPLRGLAVERGVPFLVGRSAATSMARPGPQRMTSRPFVLDHDHFSLVAFDFAGPESRIELRLAGRVVRLWRGGNTRRLQPVVWDLADLHGKTLVLDIIDPTPQAGRWIGIDELRLFDSGC